MLKTTSNPTRRTLGNFQLYDQLWVHPTPVRPTVPWGEFVQPHDEEGSGGVVEKRKTSISHRLDIFFCLYQDRIFVIAEVFNFALMAIFIFTFELNGLAFHTGNCSLDTDQSCQWHKIIVSCVTKFWLI